MKTKFTLGQAVEIMGQLVAQNVTVDMVDKVEARIKATGVPEVSCKYDVANFDWPRTGVIVGIRSVAGDRIHYLEQISGEVVTRTKREAVYLVATDMRGLVYVPVELVNESRSQALRREFMESADRHIKFSNKNYLDVEELIDFEDEELFIDYPI
ncbi:hypothetical protein [Sporosarcina sp. ITBMC105]